MFSSTPFQTPSDIVNIVESCKDMNYDVSEKSTHKIYSPMPSLETIETGIIDENKEYVFCNGKPTGYGYAEIESQGGFLIGKTRRYNSSLSNENSYIIDKFGLPLTNPAIDIKIINGTTYTNDPPFSHRDVPFIPLVPNTTIVSDGFYDCTYESFNFECKNDKWMFEADSGNSVTSYRFYLSPLRYSNEYKNHILFKEIANDVNTDVKSTNIKTYNVTKRSFIHMNTKNGEVSKYECKEEIDSVKKHGGLVKTSFVRTRKALKDVLYFK